MSAEQSDRLTAPPPELVRSLVDGPSAVRAVEWHDELDSTNAEAARRAAQGAGEILVVGAEHQSAGRGRLDRLWVAPPRRSLTFSLLLRPAVEPTALPLLPLLAGLAVAEVAAGYCRDVEVGLKWPNDLLVDGRKAAGILVEAVPGAVVAGIGLNVDWRGVERAEELADAISLAEATDLPVNRWRILAAILGVFSKRYDEFATAPSGMLAGYRSRCLTIGRDVRVELVGGAALRGRATGVDDDGGLEVEDATGATHRVSAGDVHHVRPA